MKCTEKSGESMWEKKQVLKLLLEKDINDRLLLFEFDKVTNVCNFFYVCHWNKQKNHLKCRLELSETKCKLRVNVIYYVMLQLQQY